MDNTEDIMNNAKIKKILSEMEGETHIPFEVMLADVEGKLSPDGHSKIERHMEICEGCSNIFQQIKDSFEQKEDSDEKGSDSSNISIDVTLMPKLKLVATVNSKKDEVTKEIAQLRLPENSWFCIKPAIAVYKNWLKASPEVDTPEAEARELSIAAFSDGVAEDNEDFEVVTEVVKFVDYICDLLIERCSNLEETKQKLSEFIDDAWSIFDGVDPKIKTDVLKTMESILNC